MNRMIAIVFASTLTMAGSQVLAQHAGHGSHSGHNMPASTANDPAAKAFADANAKMHKAMAIPFIGNADADFVRGMIPHHQGAVEMAEIILKFGKDHANHGLADAIIKAQKTEIGQMQAWLAKNPSPQPQAEAAAIKAAYEAANAGMHKSMSIKSSGNSDKDFLAGMIPHHEGAVAMARIVLQYGQDPELKTLANSIIASQTTEISQMREWLSKK